MQTFENIAVEDVSAIMAAMPAEARQPDAGIMWDGAILSVPEPFTTAAAAAIADMAGSRKALLINYAASVRYAKEIGGLTVNGKRFLSDRETQAKLTAAAVMGQITPTATFQWKSDDGFVALTAAQVLSVAQAVGGYVQACFAMEGTVVAAISAGTIATKEQVDGANWPPNS